MVDQQVQLRHPISLSKRTLNMGHKTPYVDVISDAILASPQRRLTAKEIFEHVSAKYGPMKKAETLKNTIRHTLSRYKVFRKVQRGRQKKPNWWTVDEDIVYSLNQTDQQGQQSNGEWQAELAPLVPIPHFVQPHPPPPIVPPLPPTAVYGVQNYLPTSKPLMFYGGTSQLSSQNPKFGPGTFAQMDMTPARVVGLADLHHHHQQQQTMIDNQIRGSHYVLSIEDSVASALTSTSAAVLPGVGQSLFQPQVIFN